MGKLLFDTTSEIKVSPDYRTHSDFPKNVEKDVQTTLSDFGEIFEFTSELVGNDGLKINCKMNVAPELVKQFEKWGEWQFRRMIEEDLRFTLNTFGEIKDFQNGYDYEPEGAESYKNMFWGNLFYPLTWFKRKRKD